MNTIVETFIKDGEAFKCLFPDQPLLLKFMPVSKQRVNITIGNRTHNVDRKLFLNTMVIGAEQFINDFIKLSSAGACMQFHLADLQEIKDRESARWETRS